MTPKVDFPVPSAPIRTIEASMWKSREWCSGKRCRKSGIEVVITCRDRRIVQRVAYTYKVCRNKKLYKDQGGKGMKRAEKCFPVPRAETLMIGVDDQSMFPLKTPSTA
jgi:hypothetical protein